MGKRVIQQRSRWTKGTKGKCPEKVHPPAGKGCDKGLEEMQKTVWWERSKRGVYNLTRGSLWSRASLPNVAFATFASSWQTLISSDQSSSSRQGPSRQGFSLLQKITLRKLVGGKMAMDLETGSSMNKGWISENSVFGHFLFLKRQETSNKSECANAGSRSAQ